MDKNNHIDDFAKNEVEGMTFEFKDAYWNEMEALLDKETKSKKRIIFWWFSGIASVLVVAFGVYLWNNSYQNNNQIASNDGRTIDSVDESKSSTEQIQHQEIVVFEQDNSQNMLVDDNTLSNQVSDQINQSNVNKVGHTKSMNNNTQNSHSDSKLPLDGNEIVQTDNKQNESVNSDNIILNDVAQFKSDEFIEPLEKRNIYEVETEETEFSPLEVNNKIKYKSLTSNVEILGGLGYGMNSAKNSHSANGMSGTLGLQFNLEYGRLAFKTGLSFGLNGINGFRYKETKRIYGFSSQEVVNEINYNSMLSASIPLYLGYSGVKHSFSAGMKLNLLLNANGKVNTWNGEGNSTNSWGYSNGLNNTWLTAGADYFYKLNRRFSVGLMIDFDLTNRGEFIVDDTRGDVKMWNVFVGVKYRLN